MSIKYEYGFDLDLGAPLANDIARTVRTLQGLELAEDKISADEDYVWWNPLGTYILYNDGDVAFYFCKGYLRINGWDLTQKTDREQSFNFLKQFAL